MKYTFFWNGPFSNWYPSEFIYKGIKFNNTEQAFMWEKAMYFGDTYNAGMILDSTHPSEAKAFGRQVVNYNDDEWSKVRYDFMVAVCLEKFKQNEKLKEILLSKENFVEASPVDKIWGIGMSEGDPGINNPNTWKGLNLLGKALDEVRLKLI